GGGAHARLSRVRPVFRRGQSPPGRPQGLRGRQGPQQPPTRERDSMSEEHRTPPVAQWGRPMRKRPRGPQAQPAAAGPGAVGPVDHPLPVGGAEAIVRSGPPREDLTPYARREPEVRREPDVRREPGELDLKLRDLAAFMARSLVDHPDDVSVEILAPGPDAAFE